MVKVLENLICLSDSELLNSLRILGFTILDLLALFNIPNQYHLAKFQFVVMNLVFTIFNLHVIYLYLKIFFSITTVFSFIFSTL